MCNACPLQCAMLALYNVQCLPFTYRRRWPASMQWIVIAIACLARGTRNTRTRLPDFHSMDLQPPDDNTSPCSSSAAAPPWRPLVAAAISCACAAAAAAARAQCGSASVAWAPCPAATSGCPALRGCSRGRWWSGTRPARAGKQGISLSERRPAANKQHSHPPHSALYLPRALSPPPCAAAPGGRPCHRSRSRGRPAAAARARPTTHA